MPAVRKTLVAIAAAAALSACASVPAAPDTDLGFGTENRASTLTVENRYVEDMDIYLLSGSAHFRLGRASSFTTTTMEIPADVLRTGRISLQAKPVGPGRGFVTEPMLIQAGQPVEFRLERNLALSGSAVWVR